MEVEARATAGEGEAARQATGAQGAKPPDDVTRPPPPRDEVRTGEPWLPMTYDELQEALGEQLATWFGDGDGGPLL